MFTYDYKDIIEWLRERTE